MTSSGVAIANWVDTSTRRRRRTDRELTAPARDACDEQIRRVRARDQPDERYRRQREPRGGPHVADNVLLQLHHAPRRTIVLVRRAPDRKQPAVDASQFRARGRSIGAAPQASERGDEEWSLARRRLPSSGDGEVLPLLERSHRLRKNAGERV